MSSLEKFSHNYHIYERSSANKRIFRCIHPDCTHYTFAHLLIGKRSECPKCHELFIIERVQLRYKKPVCALCSKSPKAKALREARELTEQKLNEMALPEDIRSILE